MGSRIICHYGMVGTGGGMSSGGAKLAGQAINYAFKIEKPAGSTGKKINLSHAAKVRLGDALETEQTGEFEVNGFSGVHKLFAAKF